MRARGMPLDLMPGTGYEEKEIILHASEAALFYSDGLVKAHDPEGKMFGFPRLRALIAEHGKDRSLGNFLLEQLYSPTRSAFPRVPFPDLRCSRQQQMCLHQEIGYRGTHNTGTNREE
jgi:hypothetical protein